MKTPSPDVRAAREIARRYTDWVIQFPNAIGCGVGRRTVGGRETDEWALVVFVTRKLPRSTLQSHEVIPRELSVEADTVLTDVVETAEPRFLADTAKYRPLVGGCQIQMANGSQGTLGAILYDATDYQPVLLTCNHVVTFPGQRDIISGDTRVYQPTTVPALGRTRLAPAVPVGRTKRIVPWTRGALNATHAWEAWVDAAIIEPDPAVDVAFEVIDLGRHPYTILPPYDRLDVVKRGFVTEDTQGTVKYIDVTIIMKEDNGQLIRMGGVGSGFAIQQIGDVFAARGDSGSLIVDKDLGAARGILFGGSPGISGWTFACEIGAILEALQLETPCTGGLHSMVQRAVRRRANRISTQVEGSAYSTMHDLMWKVDRFRHRYLGESAEGRFAGALGATLDLLAVDLAEAIVEDEDFAGLLDEAFGDWLILPTIYDMLEYRLPDDFGPRVIHAFDRLKDRRPNIEGSIQWMQSALPDSSGMKMRDLLESRVPSTATKRKGKKEARKRQVAES